MSDLEYIISGLPDKTIPTPWCVLEVNPKVPTFRVLVAMFKEKDEAELFIEAKKPKEDNSGDYFPGKKWL